MQQPGNGTGQGGGHQIPAAHRQTGGDIQLDPDAIAGQQADGRNSPARDQGSWMSTRLQPKTSHSTMTAQNTGARQQGPDGASQQQVHQAEARQAQILQRPAAAMHQPGLDIALEPA